jgi:hypothetical protein
MQGKGYELQQSQIINFITIEELYIIGQDNEFTRNYFDTGRRFLFKRVPIKVYGVDKTQNGLLTWYAKKDQYLQIEVNGSLVLADDVINDIAYYAS